MLNSYFVRTAFLTITLLGVADDAARGCACCLDGHEWGVKIVAIDDAPRKGWAKDIALESYVLKGVLDLSEIGTGDFWGPSIEITYVEGVFRMRDDQSRTLIAEITTGSRFELFTAALGGGADAYREWRFRGSVVCRDEDYAEYFGPTVTIVLQGNYNNCFSADAMTNWKLNLSSSDAASMVRGGYGEIVADQEAWNEALETRSLQSKQAPDSIKTLEQYYKQFHKVTDGDNH